MEVKKLMKDLLIKILLRVLLVLLILVVPIATYIIIEDDAQLTWSINAIKQMNKYVIFAEFFPEKEELIVTEKIEYINKTNKSIDKVFFYINDILKFNEKLCQDFADELALKEPGMPYEGEEIETVKIKNKKADFKIIGRDSNILMINLDKKLEKNDKIDIEIGYKIIISYLSVVKNEGIIKYMLNSWYPVIAKYDNGWELTTIYYNNSISKDISYFYVELVVPEGFEVQASGKLIEKTKKNKKYHFKFQDQGALCFNVSIISTKY